MRRQIIKTRSQTPYRAARVVILIVALALAAWLLDVFWWKPAHAPHAGVAATASAVRAVQDFAIFDRNPHDPIHPA